MKQSIIVLIFALLLMPKLNFSQISPAVKERVQKIYDLIKNEKIQYPEFVIAQSIVETGWMKCKNCCYDFHNLFGFIGAGNKCLKFQSDYESIQYYKSEPPMAQPSHRQSALVVLGRFARRKSSARRTNGT